MRYAILDGENVVTNIVEASPEFAEQQGWIDATGANIGDTWDGQHFIPAPPKPETVPNTVSMRQARLQLNATPMGTSTAYDAVNAAIDQMDTAAKIDWEYATDVKRDFSLVAQMQALFQWTDAQMDDFFIEASKL